ncbi:MAG: DUF4302 domain-containing protein [Prevotella sp.]|nr:DUF4302 domain-containing protein [Prevotella sp.]MBP3827779.1 DUF4302 domain-containing protein [Prevotella sp.]
MKRLKHKYLRVFAILTALCLAFTACTYEEEDLFDQSAAQRLNASAKEYRDLLTSSQYGWAMEYWPNNGTMGGYVFTAKFAEDGSVEMCSEEDITYDGKTYEPGDAFTSNYSVKSEQGTMLTFDTYNPMFHKFSEPLGSTNVSGYNSDYEFSFMRTSENQDTIYFRGKKYGQEMKMTRLEESYKTYIEKAGIIDKMFRILDLSEIQINGQSYPISISNHRIMIEVDDQKDTCNFIVNNNGFKLSHPIKISDNISISEFIREEHRFYDPKSNATIHIPTLYEQICTPKKGLYWLFTNEEAKTYLSFPVKEKLCARLYDLYLKIFSGEPYWDLGMGYPLSWGYGYNTYSTSYFGYYLVFTFMEATFMFIGADQIKISITADDINSNNPKISFEYKGKGYTGSNELTTGFINFVSFIANNNPYRVEVDNTLVAQNIKFVSVNDSKIWFNWFLNTTVYENNR